MRVGQCSFVFSGSSLGWCEYEWEGSEVDDEVEDKGEEKGRRRVAK